MWIHNEVENWLKQTCLKNNKKYSGSTYNYNKADKCPVDSLPARKIVSIETFRYSRYRSEKILLPNTSSRAFEGFAFSCLNLTDWNLESSYSKAAEL